MTAQRWCLLPAYCIIAHVRAWTTTCISPTKRLKGWPCLQWVRTLSSSSLLLSTSSSSSSQVETTTNIVDQMRRESEQEMDKAVGYFQSSQSKFDFTPPVLWTTPKQASEFINQHIDAVLFDCDGVLYRSPDPAPGAPECIQSLLEKKKQIFFVTNNASANRRQLRDKLAKILQVDGLTEEMMISSSYSAAQYLKKEILDQKGSGRLYVIGSTGLCEELERTGFTTFGPIYEKSSMNRDELAAYSFPEHPIDAVVVGHDVDMNFRKLCIANVLLQWNPDAPLIATNEDAYDLVGIDGRRIPGNGGIVKALEHTSKRKAVNCGKPSQNLVDMIASQHGLNPSRSMIVGDRLDTDIRFGAVAGMYSALVLTGVTSVDQLKDLNGGTMDEPMPSIILPHVGLLA